jgi:hypothetical protein
MTPKLVRAALVLVALVAASAELRAQRSKGPRNAPENCAWCGGDPEVMAKAGIVSHGGFPFAEGGAAWSYTTITPAKPVAGCGSPSPGRPPVLTAPFSPGK